MNTETANNPSSAGATDHGGNPVLETLKAIAAAVVVIMTVSAIMIFIAAD